jgi:hypothetical protein
MLSSASSITIPNLATYSFVLLARKDALVLEPTEVPERNNWSPIRYVILLDGSDCTYFTIFKANSFVRSFKSRYGTFDSATVPKNPSSCVNSFMFLF